MKLDEAVIAWTPGTQKWAGDPLHGTVRIGLIKDSRVWANRYCKTDGTPFLQGKFSATEHQLKMMIIYNQVVRDEIDPHDAHDAFLAIEEYRALFPNSVADDDEEE